ncbi:hypothetical protein DLAC_09975 [Tieghemostelium lacteum]|uniref:Transmembrane protein n=1 Tax=Tieghemostelium lacteum TaxID=361077 RepID=A0A151Z5T2_TIELA|nr:hypothetical protein DLAC_09975 [Tieghemostelium lacteum]|eukprot:KYQ89316.1 hypothetical protein DLAC_09975 [Tieghemostelium lacteum]
MKLILAYFIIIIIIFGSGEANVQFEIDIKSNERLIKGRELYDSIKANSRTSRCWEESMDILSGGCKGMDDVSRSRLAVKLANCHLSKSGLPTYTCTFDMSIPECTSKMDHLSFTTYTNFYISTENICYYLQSEIFQQKTEDTINHLSQSNFEALSTMSLLNNKAQYISNTIDQTYQDQQKLVNLQQSMKINMDDAYDKMGKIQDSSQSIFHSMRESNQKQQDIIESQEKLFQEQQKSSRSSLELMNDIKQSADQLSFNSIQALTQQNQLISLQSEALDGISAIGQFIDQSTSKFKQLITYQEKIFDTHTTIFDILTHLSRLQNLILNEVFDFKSIFYYLFCFFIIYFLTSNRKTNSSRIPLYMGLIIDIVLERLILQDGQYQLIIGLKDFLQLNGDFENSFNLIRVIRKLFLIYSVIVYILSFIFYKDYDKLNHQILLEIKSQNNLLLQQFQQLSDRNTKKSSIQQNQNESFIEIENDLKTE